jgi:hypothetical protein
MANLGFQTVMLKGMEVTWDQLVPCTAAASTTLLAYDAGTKAEEICYFLNTDYLYLISDTGTDFVFTPAVNHEAGGQYATSGSLLWMGEHLCTNRRAQGVLRGVDVSAITLTT